MNNPYQIQLLTTDQSREETQRNQEAALENAKEKIQKVTVSEKRFHLTVIVLSLVIMALMIALWASLWPSGSSNAPNGSPETCWSKECVGVLAMIKNYQNASVDPCEDFFEHTCGRYSEHVMDDNSWGYVQYKQLLYQVFAIARKTNKFNSKPNEQLRIFTKSCLDRKEMDEDTFQDLRNDIEERGGFPMIDPNWNEEKFDLSDMLAKYLSINRNRMGFLSVEPYAAIEGNKSVNRLYVSPGPHWVYNWAMGISIYKDSVAFMLRRLLKLENRELNETIYDKEFAELVQLEANFSTLADYRNLALDNDNMSKSRNLTDLVKMIPEIDWIKILKALARHGTSEEDEEKLLERVTVHGAGEYFFGENRELARIATETPKSALANYLVVRQLIDVALYFYDKDQPRQNKFYNHVDQQSFCATQVASFFPMPSMNVFIESSQFKIENLKVIEEMFVKIKAEYEQIFTENEYLELEIREFLIRKLNAIDGKFGLDQYTEGKPLLEKMYETLNFLDTDSPWQVYMKMWRHWSEQLVEHIVHDTPLDPVNLKMFGTHAAYQPYPNHFYINLPYLTYPWMDADFPANTNYGYLGYVIGHEIGHAFDHFHRKLDESGRQQQYWFTETNSSNTEYELREKCLRDQYSAYKEPGYDFFMNGTHCRYEIAGDHMGIRTAFRVFEKVKKEDRFRLPGLEMSEEQLFFYNYAFRQCDVYNPNKLPRNMLARQHPTNRYRVNGVIQNIPEFAEAFNCPKNSPMNPEMKCKLY